MSFRNRAGIHTEIATRLDGNRHDIERTRCGAASVDAVVIVNRAVAGAAELIEIRRPGHGAAEVDALPVEGEQTVRVMDDVELAGSERKRRTVDRRNILRGNCQHAA